MNIEEHELQNNDCQYYVPNEFCVDMSPYSHEEQLLSFLHCNYARSLPKNVDSLNMLLSSLKFGCSIIGITETWLTARSPPLFM